MSLRILFISNLYPAHDLGGWEQNCREVVDRLRLRGHVCHVLTSRHGVRGLPAPEDGVERVLWLQADIYHYRPADFFLRRAWRDRANRGALGRALEAFEPDIVFVWGMWNLSAQLAYWAERYPPQRVAYAVAGYWLIEPDVHQTYWQGTARRLWVRVLMTPARRVALRVLAREKESHLLELEHVACVSEHVRRRLTEAGALPHGARVIYNGIDPEPFLEAAVRREPSLDVLRLVYTGGLGRHKGVHTAIEAMGVLQGQGQADGLHLAIVGGGHPDYQKELRERVQDLGLGSRVTFRGRLAREDIPAVLAQSDVFLFTSTWDEPIARAVMEAMAAGLAVVGTAVGGQREMLQDGANALVFPCGDADALARCIARLRRNPDLRLGIAEAGRRTVLERFTLRRMVDEMEAWLQGIVR